MQYPKSVRDAAAAVALFRCENAARAASRHGCFHHRIETHAHTTPVKVRLHSAAGCTTGWVNYANEPRQAALERSSHDAYDVIRLTRSKATVWTVDVVARLIELQK